MASSAALSAQSQRLSAWSTSQAAALPEVRSSRRKRCSRTSTGTCSTQAVAKAGASADSGTVAAIKGILQPLGDLARDSDTASKGSQLVSKLRGGLAEGAAKAKGSLPAPDPPQEVSQSFDLSALQEKGIKGLELAARGLEDALLPPKPPEPPKLPEPTDGITSGAKSQIASATPADVKSAPGSTGHATSAAQRHNEATATAARPQADLSQASHPTMDLSDAASQAQSDLADSIGQASDSAQSSLTTAGDQLSNAASPGTPSLSGASSQAGEAASSTSDAVSQAQSAASDAVSSAGSSLADAYEAATQGSRRITDNLLGNPRQAAATAQDGVQGAVSDVKHSFQEALSGLTRAAQEALAAMQSTASQASSSVNTSSGNAVQQAQQAVQGAADASTSALSGAAAQANAAAASVVSALPPEVREAAAAVKGPLQQAFSQIAADSNLRTAAGAAVAVPAFLIWRSRRGGFSGYLSPDAALDLLNKRNAVLIDLRSDELREAEGVPELRFGARGKGAAIAIPALKRSLTSRSRDGGDLPYAVAAVEIQGLRQVTRRSQIIILEPSKKTGLKLARALQSQGQAKTYILQGGFSAWASAGLPIKTIAEYGTSALDALTDEAEILATRTRSAVGYLSDPINLVITLILAAGVVNTARDWHNTLQILGVYGPVISTGLWYREFESPQAAADDASKRLNSFLSFFAKLVPKTPPARPISQPAAATATAGPSPSTADSGRLTNPFQQALTETKAKAPAAASSASGQKPPPQTQSQSQPQTQPKSQQQTQQPPEAGPQRQAASSPKPASASQQQPVPPPSAPQESALKPSPTQKVSSSPAQEPAAEKTAAEPAAIQAATAQASPSKKTEPPSAGTGNSQPKSSVQQQPAPQAKAASGSQKNSLGQTKEAEAAVKKDTRTVSEK